MSDDEEHLAKTFDYIVAEVKKYRQHAASMMCTANDIALLRGVEEPYNEAEIAAVGEVRNQTRLSHKSNVVPHDVMPRDSARAPRGGLYQMAVEIVQGFGKDFTSIDLIEAIVNRTDERPPKSTFKGTVQRLREEGIIDLVEEASGRKPPTYRLKKTP